ncbi:molybdenum cofactor guanylyltransferase MobA [Stappia sp. F7233]|uniref:Molybdenum cofactor guanylyltransferase n=1 Tax=Stappia albiluteola TaxID=2758565 RepID=A0A839AC91_9HYPH|nr:molybdenum cofactor guanylyltransferase MobA [Stappia albiluteola]MBA5776604.1 molybdenum cofactor guanylyltransferase MobA [Stappia albiluteola]
MRKDVIGCILAGGLARRMGGGDKPLRDLAGKPVLAHVIKRLSPQVGAIVLNANGDPARFDDFSLPVIADPIGGFAGPLAGVLAGLLWARDNHPEAHFVATVAGDTPFFPQGLVARLREAAKSGGEIVLARSNEGLHPVFGLWPVTTAGDLERFLQDGETRKVLAFVDRHPHRSVLFDTYPGRRGAEGIDPFFNINTAEQLAEATTLARELDA